MFRILGLVGLVMGVLIASALFYASSRWNSGTRELRARLEAARAPIAPRRYDPSQVDSLPGPVQRYLRQVLKPGQPMIAAVRLRHAGTFNLGDPTPHWVRFTSDQRVITRRPGFDWDARITMAPGIIVRAHDAYIDGEGLLHAALLAMFPLVIQRGTLEVSEGELMRFLAEAAWYPTVLLPGQGVRWEARDDRSAVATIQDGPLSASLRFQFGDDDLIESVVATRRARVVAGRSVPTAWVGRWSEWMWLNGVRVPTRGEVAWLPPEGPLPYWRGGVVGITYDEAR